MTPRSILESFNAPRIPLCWATIGGNQEQQQQQGITMATAIQSFTVAVVVVETR